MVDKAADKVAFLLWRTLQWTCMLLLVILLTALVADVLLSHASTLGGGAAPVCRELVSADLARVRAGAGTEPVAAGSWPVSVRMTSVPASPTATSTDTTVPPTVTPLAPSLPNAGQLALQGDAEAVLGLASQARWQRARANAAPSTTPTPAMTPQPTPTPQLLPSPTAVAANPPTRIVAPSINLDARIVAVKWNKIKQGGREVLSWVVPRNDVGWHFTSAKAGEPGNMVLTGHRNIYAEVFRYIPNLKVGDPITLYAGDRAFVYYVEEQHVVQEVGVPAHVREENARWIARTDDTRLTLVTCAPYEAPGNTHRVIVVARP